MSIETFQSHSAPFGEPIPADNPHAVSVSLPTIHDVNLVFRDKNPQALADLQTIYPRFGEHPYVQAALEAEDKQSNRTVVAICSPQAAEQIVAVTPAIYMPDYQIRDADELTFLSWAETQPEPVTVVRHIMKRLGVAPSSRRAEDFLVNNGLVTESFDEPISHRANETSIARHLQQVYAPACPDVLLANSGMNALNAAVEAVQQARNPGNTADGTDTWIVLGNLYHDSTDLMLDKQPTIKTKLIRDVKDLAGLQALLKASGNRISGVITEAVGNPLGDVPDLEKVKDLIGSIPLIVDVSTAGSAVVDALPYADVIVESLTKSASGNGDLMMGAVIVNTDSEYIFDLRSNLPYHIQPPYIRDIQRLGYEMNDWRDRSAKTGKNVIELVNFFNGRPEIAGIYWSGSNDSRRSFYNIARDAMTHAGIVTIETVGDVAPVYDNLDLSKGLSFGTRFTLNTAYVHVTHPHEIGNHERERMLANRTSLNPRMLRISVGTERPDQLINKYETALSK